MNAQTLTPEQLNAVHIAVIQNEVAHLKAALVRVESTNAQQSAKLDTVLSTLTEAKGGWRALMWVGGVATTLGGGFGWALSHLKFT